MNQNLLDSELRARFQELRKEEDALAPAFRLPAPEVQPRRVVGLVWWAAAAIAVVALIGLLRPGTADVPTLADWQSPTEFLLPIGITGDDWTSPTTFLLNQN